MSNLFPVSMFITVISHPLLSIRLLITKFLFDEYGYLQGVRVTIFEFFKRTLIALMQAKKNIEKERIWKYYRNVTLSHSVIRLCGGCANPVFSNNPPPPKIFICSSPTRFIKMLTIFASYPLFSLFPSLLSDDEGGSLPPEYAPEVKSTS